MMIDLILFKRKMHLFEVAQSFSIAVNMKKKIKLRTLYVSLFVVFFVL